MTQIPLFGPPPTPEAPARAPPAAGPAQLASWLRGHLGQPVDVVLTTNRQSLARIRREGGRIGLRVVASVLDDGGTAWPALLEWIRAPDPRRRAAVVEALRHCQSRVPVPDVPATAPPPVPPPSVTAGRVHDLGAILRDENELRFGGRFDGAITWGRDASPRGRRRRHLRLGSWDATARLVRIHPALDRAEVPVWIVSTTVHHELLHWELGTDVVGGRRRVHPPEFRAREATHPDYARSVAWLRRHLHGL